MRVLQAEKYYWQQGGASRYALDLSRSLETSGEVVVPFASAHPRNMPSVYSDYFVSALDFANLGEAGWWQKMQAAGQIIYSFEARKKIAALLDKYPVDVAHLHNIYHQISPSIIPEFKKRQIPVVMTLHDYKLLTPNYTFFHHDANHEEDAKGWYLNCISNKCFKDNRLMSALVTVEMIFHHKIKRYYENGVDIFLAPSNFCRELFIKNGWDGKKIIHLSLPVDVPAESVSRPGSYVLYVGRLVEEKGVQHLIEAAAMTPQITYKIIGQGPYRDRLQSLIEERKLTNVMLLGYKQGRELKEIIADARLVVTPSIWYENYPQSVLEAKAAGKIIIASSIGGLPELLPPDLLVAPGDAVTLAKKIETWFSASDQKLISRGAELREEVKKINDPEGHRRAIMEVYNNVLSR